MQRNWACLTWKSTIEIKSSLLLSQLLNITLSSSWSSITYGDHGSWLGVGHQQPISLGTARFCLSWGFLPSSFLPTTAAMPVCLLVNSLSPPNCSFTCICSVYSPCAVINRVGGNGAFPKPVSYFRKWWRAVKPCARRLHRGERIAMCLLLLQVDLVKLHPLDRTLFAIIVFKREIVCWLLKVPATG